jgi:hypothetical protein
VVVEDPAPVVVVVDPEIVVVVLGAHIAEVWQVLHVLPWNAIKLHVPGLPVGWQPAHLPTSALPAVAGVPV